MSAFLRFLLGRRPSERRPGITCQPTVPAELPIATALSNAVRKAKLSRNVQSRVARELGVSRSHVCMVANGHRTSARVTKALEREFRRIEEAAK